MVKLYILTLPFTSAFALFSFLPVPLLLVSMISFFLITKQLLLKKSSFSLELHDKILLIFLLEVLLSYAINFYSTGFYFKSLSHLLSYFIIIIYFYLTVKYLLYIQTTNLQDVNKIFQYIFYIVLFSSLFGILEFISKNYYHFPIEDFVYRPSVQHLDALAMGFYRTRSFTEEPGHFALFLEIFSPLAFYYISNKNFVFKILFILIVFFSFITTFSSAGIIIVASSYIIIFFYYYMKSGFKKKRTYWSIIIFLFFIGFLIVYNFDLILNIYSYINLKLNDSISVNDRIHRIQNALLLFDNANIFQILFGYGPAGYIIISKKSIISLYFLFLIETGTIGLCLFLSFQIKVLFVIINLNSKVKYYFLLSFVTSSLHYLLISNYWYPWYWFLISLIGTIKYNSNTSKIFLKDYLK